MLESCCVYSMGGDTQSPLNGDVHESLEALHLAEGDNGAVEDNGSAPGAVSLDFLFQLKGACTCRSFKGLD